MSPLCKIDIALKSFLTELKNYTVVSHIEDRFTLVHRMGLFEKTVKVLTCFYHSTATISLFL